MKITTIIVQTVVGLATIAIGLYSLFFMWEEYPAYSLFLLFGTFVILSMFDRIKRDKTKETLLEQTVIKKPDSLHINIGYQCYSHNPKNPPFENECFTEYLLDKDKTYIIRIFERIRKGPVKIKKR